MCSVVITFPSPTQCVPDRKKTRPRYPCVSPIVGAAPKQPSLTTYSFGEGKRQGRHTEGGIKKFQQLHNIPVMGEGQDRRRCFLHPPSSSTGIKLNLTLLILRSEEVSYVLLQNLSVPCTRGRRDRTRHRSLRCAISITAQPLHRWLPLA